MPKRSPECGFTVMEVMVVAGIGMLVMAITLPSITSTIANAKLRASMTSLSGLIQNCRMVAVQQNKTKTAHVETNASGLIAYIKDATDTSDVSSSDYQIAMEAPIERYATLPGTDAPDALSTTQLGFSMPETGNPSFNSRGLPCLYGTVCVPNYGFLSYYKDTRISGSGGWAAISVSPAGRIKRWFWTGSAWVS
jgi:Tfp pilus assembly protein FimT